MTLEDLYRLLRSGHVQAQGVVDTMSHPILVLDRGLSVLTANNAFIKAFGVERDDVVDTGFFDLGNGQWDIPELRALIEGVLPKAAAVVGFEVEHDFPVIGRRTFLVDARRLVHPDNNSSNILVQFEDVTERREADVEKDFMVSETRHRLKNILAMTRVIAMQTDATGRTAAEYRDALLGRLEVLFRAQEISATNEAADFESLLRQAVGEVGVARLETAGPPVKVAGKTIFALSLIFHELTTNAVKYGSFSTSTGSVHVHWTLEEGPNGIRSLRCDWREKNGPKVSPPSRSGYGSDLIDGVAAHGGGSVERMFHPDGLTAVINIPV
jgi:PAS domain S-box-containing protein